jgi:hypothetical protein
MIVLIDSSVLGILANPNKLGEAKECEEWLYKLLLSTGQKMRGKVAISDEKGFHRKLPDNR